MKTISKTRVVREVFQQDPDPPPDLTGNIDPLEDVSLDPLATTGVYLHKCQYHNESGTREVAVKTFLVSTATKERDEKLIEIRREVAIWRRLSHANISPLLGVVYGFGGERALSLVSLWRPSGDLAWFLVRPGERLAVDQRLQLLLDISRGLQYLHSLHIVHGNLNPTNILIDERGNAVLNDFGNAFLMGDLPESLSHLKPSRIRPGLLNWTAPEYIFLDKDDVDQLTTKSDIYSFGSIALQVLSGRRPWSELRSVTAILTSLHEGRNPERPQSLPIDDRCWALIEHCWSAVDNRPPAGYLVATIQDFLRSHPQSESLSEVLSRNPDPLNLTGKVEQEGGFPFASGTYGDIFKGSLSVNNQSVKVAIKTIRVYLADDGNSEKKSKRLRREINVWLRLDHINILPLFGIATNFGQFPAMICPWAEHGSLTSYLEHGDTLDKPQRLVMINDVASGLHYLHSKSVVHGDLSGSNILVLADGIACISDFGLSTLLTELGGTTFSTSSQVKGTLRWMAPELLDIGMPEAEEQNGEPNEEQNTVQRSPDVQSDVYSFGSIMLQILTGKAPYYYYVRDVQILQAISKGMIPRRPSDTQVTNDQWLFLKRCWLPAGGAEARPSSSEIVVFTENEQASYGATARGGNGEGMVTRLKKALMQESRRGTEEFQVDSEESKPKMDKSGDTLSRNLLRRFLSRR